MYEYFSSLRPSNITLCELSLSVFIYHFRTLDHFYSLASMKNVTVSIDVKIFSCLEARSIGDRFKLDLRRVPRLAPKASAHCYFPSVYHGAFSMELSFPKSSSVACRILTREQYLVYTDL